MPVSASFEVQTARIGRIRNRHGDLTYSIDGEGCSDGRKMKSVPRCNVCDRASPGARSGARPTCGTGHGFVESSQEDGAAARRRSDPRQALYREPSPSLRTAHR